MIHVKTGLRNLNCVRSLDRTSPLLWIARKARIYITGRIAAEIDGATCRRFDVTAALTRDVCPSLHLREREMKVSWTQVCTEIRAVTVDTVGQVM